MRLGGTWIEHETREGQGLSTRLGGTGIEHEARYGQGLSMRLGRDND